MRKILTVALLLMSLTVFAQQHSVKGTVTDQNGLPVIGMAVQEQGTANGVVTDENGEYSITVSSPQASLEFNSLGYETVVSTDDMTLRPVSEASGFIQGKVAGVQVQQTSGLPGGDDSKDQGRVFNRFQQ